MEKQRLVLLVLLAILVVPAAWAASIVGVTIPTNLSFTRPPTSSTQGITGNITIGNTEPLCSVNPGIVPAQGPNLVAQPIWPVLAQQTIIQ